MTEEQQQKLADIKAQCRLAIELYDKAMPGPWEVQLMNDTGPYDESFWESYEAGPAKIGGENSRDDAAFMAHASAFSPAAARALLTAIEGLERCASPWVAEKTLVEIVTNWTP